MIYLLFFNRAEYVIHIVYQVVIQVVYMYTGILHYFIVQIGTEHYNSIIIISIVSCVIPEGTCVVLFCMYS